MKGAEQEKGGLADLVGRARQRTTEYAFAQALSLLGKASDENYRRLAGLLEQAAGDDETKKMVAQWIKHYLSPGQPGVAWVKHLLNSVDPKVRRCYVARWLTNIVFSHGPGSRTLPDGRELNIPECIVFSPTMRCNLGCIGCYAGKYTKEDDLTPDEVRGVMREAHSLGTRFFVFSGGEPLMYEALFDIFEEFDDCVFQFYTSGHLMTPEKAKRIVKLGNVVPAVSVEGFQAETDARRGPGGFDRVVRCFAMLREAGALFAFSATGTRRNLDTITSDAFAEWLVEQGAHYGFFFSYMPIGRNPDLSLMPTPQERNRLRMAAARFRNNYPILVADFWNDGAISEGCLSGARHYIHINNKGDVEPCVFAHFAVDNVKRKSLQECLASDFFRALRKAAPYGKNLLRPCPIIDHPKVLRTLVKKYGAYPTHDGAETIVTDLADFLDDYSKRLAELYNPIWARDFCWAAKLHGKPQYDWSQDPVWGARADAETEANIVSAEQSEAEKVAAG
mgnify:CR=1 FL=1